MKNKRMNLQHNNFLIGRLENIELQQVSTWWDCLFYFIVIVCFLTISNFLLLIVVVLFALILIQISEGLNKRKIIKKYDEFKKQQTKKIL